MKKEEVILNLVRSILRKDLLETQEDDLKDGILFIRCYNLRRKRTLPALIVELPAPRETVLSLNKSRWEIGHVTRLKWWFQAKCRETSRSSKSKWVKTNSWRHHGAEPRKTYSIPLIFNEKMISFETVGHPKPFRACFIINDHKVETCVIIRVDHGPNNHFWPLMTACNKKMNCNENTKYRMIKPIDRRFNPRLKQINQTYRIPCRHRILIPQQQPVLLPSFLRRQRQLVQQQRKQMDQPNKPWVVQLLGIQFL